MASFLSRFSYLNLTQKLSKMRKLMFVAAVLFPLVSFCQLNQEQAKEDRQEKQEKSKLETFSLKSGNLIKKEFHNMGKIKGIDIDILKITDVINKATVSGVRLQ